MNLYAEVKGTTEICADCDFEYFDNQTVVLTIDPETAGSRYTWTCWRGHTAEVANDAEVTLQLLGADYVL